VKQIQDKITSQQIYSSKPVRIRQLNF